MYYLLELTLLYLTLFLEIAGAIIISYSAFFIFIRFFYLKFIEPSTLIRLRFARSIALGLEFQLAGEILRTVSVRRLEDLYIVAVLLVLRAFMTFLIHWEIDHDSRIAEKESNEFISD